MATYAASAADVRWRLVVAGGCVLVPAVVVWAADVPLLVRHGLVPTAVLVAVASAAFTRVAVTEADIHVTHLGLFTRVMPIGQYAGLTVHPRSWADCPFARMAFVAGRSARLTGLPRRELDRLAADLDRLRVRHCARCGYDLRATPDRCPECGTAAAGSATV